MHRQVRHSPQAAYVAVAALALFAAACGGDDDAGSGDTVAVENTVASTDATEASDEPPETTDSTDATATTVASTEAPDEPADTTATTVASTEAPVEPADPLGETNEATGAPIKVGVVVDAASGTADSSPILDMVKATLQYANDHLGGINGHVIEVEECLTQGTPAGATLCGVQMVQSGVAAALVPVSIQDGSIFEGMAGSNIPYFTYTSATPSILGSPGAYLLTNPISQIAVPGLVAQEAGHDTVGFIIIDNPAATGPITAIAEPMYRNLGIALQIFPIAASVADMSPNIQAAILGGADVISVTGTDEFYIRAVNALRQQGFEGPVVTGALSQSVIDGVGDGIVGIVGTGTSTDDPTDEDVQLFDAVIAEYAPGLVPDAQTPGAFADALAFVRALTGVTDAVDAASVTAALSAMPEPVPLPLGGGITFQCGTAPVAFAPNICSTNVVQWTYGEGGERSDFGLLNVPPEILTLG